MAEEVAGGTEQSVADPVLARFLLEDRLRQLREADGRGPNALAAAAGVSLGTWKRWARGDIAEWRAPQIYTVMVAFGYHHDHPETVQLLQLATAARQMNITARPEWPRSSAFDLLVALEGVSEIITTYEMTIIPGLLQTPGYARAHLAYGWGDDEGDLEERVRVRIDRQRILVRTTPQPVEYRAVIDEAILHRPPAVSGVMREQLEHLLALSALPNVTLLVIPFAGGPYRTGGNGPFVQLDSRRVGRQITYVETSLANTYYETPEANRRYADAWNALASRALGRDESTDTIRELVDSTTGTPR